MSLYKNELLSRTRQSLKNKVELDLSDYAKKIDAGKAADVDTSEFTKKTNLASLKRDLDKLDIDKSKNCF